MTCSAKECERKAEALGFCMKHYARWRRTGDANSPVRGTGGKRPSNAICSVETCTEPAESRGWCSAHYQRWRKSGDPLFVKRVVSQDGPLATFWSYVDKRGPDECWPWKRPPMAKGYGQLQWLDGTVWYTHRIAYVLAYGEIPVSDDPGDPIELDHMCHDHEVCGLTNTCPHRLCCNPAHLVAKPRSQNTGRTAFWLSCPEDCTCGRHQAKDCSPDCTCGRHGNGRHERTHSQEGGTPEMAK